MNVEELTPFALAVVLCGCMDRTPSAPAMSRKAPDTTTVLRTGEHKPNAAETQVVGALEERIVRGSAAFTSLVRDGSDELVYKDEEGTGADRMMTPKLRLKLHQLGALVQRQWPRLCLRVTEAWDEQGEHGQNSLHYEGRAADLTISDLDSTKLGKLAGLAVDAGFDWVYYEQNHVHVSVRK